MGETAHLRYRFLRSNNVKTPLECGFYGVLWLLEGGTLPLYGVFRGYGVHTLRYSNLITPITKATACIEEIGSSNGSYFSLSETIST